MLEQTNWYFSWKEYTVNLLHCIPSDFKNDKNQKIMFFGDIYLYF